MCGRFVTIIPPDILAKIFGLIEKPQVEPRYNVAPTQNVGVVRCCVDTNHNRSGGKKQPYYIQLANHSPMCLAGLWESWKTPEGNELETFAVLTTTANKLVEPVHDRMPVILYPDTFTLWLSHNMHDPEQLQPLYTPFPADEMTAYKVPDLVNNARFDSPACIAQV